MRRIYTLVIILVFLLCGCGAKDENGALVESVLNETESRVQSTEEINSDFLDISLSFEDEKGSQEETEQSAVGNVEIAQLIKEQYVLNVAMDEAMSMDENMVIVKASEGDNIYDCMVLFNVYKGEDIYQVSTPEYVDYLKELYAGDFIRDYMDDFDDLNLFDQVKEILVDDISISDCTLEETDYSVKDANGEVIKIYKRGYIVSCDVLYPDEDIYVFDSYVFNYNDAYFMIVLRSSVATSLYSADNYEEYADKMVIDCNEDEYFERLRSIKEEYGLLEYHDFAIDSHYADYYSDILFDNTIIIEEK